MIENELMLKLLEIDIFRNLVKYSFLGVYFSFLLSIFLMIILPEGIRTVLYFWYMFWVFVFKFLAKLTSKSINFILKKNVSKECLKKFKNDFHIFFHSSYENDEISDDEVIEELLEKNPKMFWDIYFKYQKMYFLNKNTHYLKYKKNHTSTMFF
jgi:CBS domain containing-hemolysin-like protein